MGVARRLQSAFWNTLAFLKNRKKAYQLTFSQPAGKEVLADLLRFSKWRDGPARPTNEETWRLIGRQDVVRRIEQHGSLSTEQLFALYNQTLDVSSIEQVKEDDDNG